MGLTGLSVNNKKNEVGIKRLNYLWCDRQIAKKSVIGGFTMGVKSADQYLAGCFVERRGEGGNRGDRATGGFADTSIFTETRGAIGIMLEADPPKQARLGGNSLSHSFYLFFRYLSCFPTNSPPTPNQKHLVLFPLLWYLLANVC